MSERYVVREHQVGRFMFYGVYDTERSSWPSLIAGRPIAHTTQDREQAQKDADWLNQRAAGHG